MDKYKIVRVTGESRLQVNLFNALTSSVEANISLGWTPLGGVQAVALDDYTLLLAQTMTRETRLVE